MLYPQKFLNKEEQLFKQAPYFYSGYNQTHLKIIKDILDHPNDFKIKQEEV